MTTEEAKKPKNPDYSESAIKLNNAPEVKSLFDVWLKAKQLSDEAQVKMNEELQALPSAVAASEAHRALNKARAALEDCVVDFGGYQDVEQGLYALQQKRISITYDPDKIREFIPEYADKILIQADASRIKGLVKGGLVTEAQVAKCSEAKESKRFVIEARE